MCALSDVDLVFDAGFQMRLFRWNCAGTHDNGAQVAATLAFNFSLYISREDIDTLLAFLVPTVHALNNKNTSLTDDVGTTRTPIRTWPLNLKRCD